jgi:hypothetical protein
MSPLDFFMQLQQKGTERTQSPFSKMRMDETYHHTEKDASLWSTVRARMRSSRKPTIRFNLDDFSIPSHNLDQLVAPFTNSEIDQIIRQMPMDKALGPYGFNAKFLKKC